MKAESRIISFREYCEADGVNMSHLLEMAKSPLHYATYASRPRKETAALRIGRPIHTCVLEPDLFDTECVVWAGGEIKSGKRKGERTFSHNSADYKEFKANMDAAGKVVLSHEERMLCRDIRHSVLQDKTASEILSAGTPERSVFFEHPLGVWCKIRTDWNRSGIIADLKSTVDVRPDEFGRSAYKYNYHARAAFYVDGMEVLTGESHRFILIAVEKTPPYDVVCYEVGEAELAAGRRLYTDLLLRLINCQGRNEWPGVSGVNQDLKQLQMPDWAYSEWDDASIVVDGEEVSFG